MWPFKKKESNWKLVKTIESTINWINKSVQTEQTDEIYYYLYEEYSGKRRMEWKTTDRHSHFISTDRETVVKRHPYYLKNVYPWLNGEEYQDIPSYRDKADDENEVLVKELYIRLLKNS